MLAYAERNGDRATAVKFGVAARTLQRYRRRMNAGELPELAVLVANQKRRAIERVTDLLTETYELALTTLKDKLPGATVSEVIEAVKTTGELRITRGVLGGADDGEQPVPDPASTKPPAAEGAGTRRAPAPN